MLSKKILIVDDVQMIVDLCLHTLTTEGFDITTAHSGEEAIKMASTNHFQLLITDLLMPGLNGLETFQTLKEKQPGLIGVLMTGYGTLDIAIQAMELGFNRFIKKPFKPDELIRIVKETFQKNTLMEENAQLKTLIPLFKLGEKFITSQTKEKVLDELTRTISRQVGAERVSIMLYSEKDACLKIVSSVGIDVKIVDQARKRPRQKISGWVFEKGEPVILNGGPKDNPRFASFLNSKNISAAMSFPLKARDHTLGVVNVSRIEKRLPFSHTDIEMLSVICSQAVMAIENVKTMNERSEKLRTRTLLEQYVAPEVAEKLIYHGQNPLEVGEIKDITVLFADIRNFTPLVRQLPLEILRSFLNDVFDLVAKVIFKSKGTLDKFMGDSVLAIFGAPNPLKEPQNTAVNAAIEILTLFRRLEKKWLSSNISFSRIGLGIGITSGEMFLGNVGSKRRFDYTVIGTDVNLAQRLGATAASGQILFTKRVKDHLSSQFPVTQESPRLLKGMEKPTVTFSISV